MLQTEKAVYVIEVKRKREIVEEVSRKLNALPVAKGKAKRSVLVYEGHLAPRVEASDFFDFIIDFQDLMKSPCGCG